MAIKAVIGGQWGDEGKGKIVDLLSKDSEIVARYQGGANAGHTVYKNDEKIVLHQIPSGILRKDCYCIMGNGMVVDPIELVEEINMLRQKNISTENIIISPNAHIVTPLHKYLDRKNEEKTNNFIGTTCKGIGPCYVDKYNRVGIRALDLSNSDKLKAAFIIRMNQCISNHQITDTDYETMKSEISLFFEACNDIKIYVKDTLSLLFSKKNILIEGAQGTLLDIDHGTYPFVTSSNTVSSSAATGSGCGPNSINYILGITKAYTTRVGAGPFPTELTDDIGEELGKMGNEFGTVTSRKRRCGWLDGVLVRQTIKISGINSIALTKLDVLDQLNEIKICVEYELNGKKIDYFPASALDQLNIKPVYKVFKGWKSSTREIKEFDKLPENAKIYIKELEKFVETKVSSISTSPERKDTILIENPF